MNDLEAHVFAYYVAHGARDFTMAGRWFPYGELTIMLEDKVKIANRPFGKAVVPTAKAAGTAFVDLMIAKGGFSSKDQKFGGTMHQYHADQFRAALDELDATDPVLQQAKAGGPDFWEKAFAQLTAA